MFEMLLNLVLAIVSPNLSLVANVGAFFALAFLLLGFGVGIAVLIGVIRARDMNFKRRFRGVFWAARVPSAADQIAVLRGEDI